MIKLSNHTSRKTHNYQQALQSSEIRVTVKNQKKKRNCFESIFSQSLMASLLGRSLVGFLLLLLVLCMQCVAANPSVPTEFESTEDTVSRTEKTPKIVNGDTAVKNAYPFIVSMHKKLFHNFSYHMCAASVYDQFHVITAAHCVENTNASDLILIFGEFKQYEVEGEEEFRNVSSMLIHADYNPNALWVNDIAILDLEQPINFTKSIQPICLTHKPVVPGEQTYVMGWGDTKQTADKRFLQVTMLPIVGREQCNHNEWITVPS